VALPSPARSTSAAVPTAAAEDGNKQRAGAPWPDLPAGEQFAVDIPTGSALQEELDPPARLHGIFDHIDANQDDVVACGRPRPSTARRPYCSYRSSQDPVKLDQDGAACSS
jgi:hypothetical protein